MSALPRRRLDELDRRILAELQEDGRRSLREIGKTVNVAAATVRARLNDLIDDGVVEIVALPNPWRLGLGFFAVVGLHLEPGHADAVADSLAERTEVSWVGVAVTGYDVMCEVIFEDARDFAEYREQVLAEMPGFRGCEVFVMSDVRKLRYRMNATPEQDDDEKEAA